MKMKKLYSMLAAGLLVCPILAGCGSDSDSKEDTPAVQQVQEQEGETEASADTESEAVQREEDGGYKKGALIKEQTFDVTLRPLGEVTFASYEPDSSEEIFADAVFQVEKDGEVLTQLPAAAKDNIGLELFNQVEAVSFYDYNNDAYDDIILILSYYLGAGPQAATPHSLVRYYSGTKEGGFVYEDRMSEDASGALTEITIQAAKDFVSPKRAEEPGGSDSSLKPWQQEYIRYLTTVSDPDVQTGYTLIDMKGDGTLQLVEVGNCEASGCRIIFYDGREIQVVQLNRLYFSYIPGENLLCNSDGHMDFYYDLVYSIVDGEMTSVASGYYGAEDNSNVQFDANGEPIYYYEWDGVKMSREQYEKEFHKMYDKSKAVSYDFENLYSIDEVIKAVEEYSR